MKPFLTYIGLYEARSSMYPIRQVGPPCIRFARSAPHASDSPGRRSPKYPIRQQPWPGDPRNGFPGPSPMYPIWQVGPPCIRFARSVPHVSDSPAAFARGPQEWISRSVPHVSDSPSRSSMYPTRQVGPPCIRFARSVPHVSDSPGLSRMYASMEYKLEYLG
jgi:hypothetical protein